jgi:serine/threonine-protein kinase
MGQVWRAYDTETTREVAIKLLPEHLVNDPTYQARFRREARIAAGLNDPHIVPIHHFGEIDGRLYVDMRLIDGPDLGSLLARRPLDAPRAVAIIEQVASALDEAHRAGLVHRDVKPSNILVAKEDFAYLIDFGIARDTDDGGGITSTGLFMGTLAYMAPERFNSGVFDVRTDTYALACVLYEALTGLPPYPGDSLEQLQVGHVLCPPPRPSTEVIGVPRRLDDVIATGLAKDPAQRYPSGKALVQAARSALDGASRERTTPLGRPVSLPTHVVPAQDPGPRVPPEPPRFRERATTPAMQHPPRESIAPIPAPRPIPAPAPSPPTPPSPPIPPIPDDAVQAPPGESADGSPGQHWAIAIWVAVATVVVITVAAVGVALFGGSETDSESTSSSKRSLSVASSTTSEATTTSPTGASWVPPATQRLMEMLSEGFGPSNCAAARELTAGAIAVVDCTQNTLDGGPKSARYFLYANASDLADQFTATIGGNTTFPCEKGESAPQEWRYESETGPVAGQASCGTLNGTPQLVWTETDELLMASAQGPDINGLLTWFSAHV